MDVTLTVAIIAALSGMISPSITSIISSRAAYRNKMIDLYFDKQIQAYSDLIRAGMEYEKSETKENEMNVNDAVPLAALLSAPKTRNAIDLYLIFLFSEPHYMKSSRVRDARESMIESMKENLKNHPRNQYYRRKSYKLPHD